MATVFIVVLVIMIVMNTFIHFALRGIASKVGRQIQQEAARQLTAYDGLLEEKSHALQALQERLERVSAQFPADAAQGKQEPHKGAVLMPLAATAYRAEDFSGSYQAVKEHFNFDLREILAQLQQEIAPDADAPERPYAALMALLPFETRYRLSLIPGKSQLEVLREGFSPEQCAVLEEYTAEHPRFDAIAFYDWLELAARSQDTAVQVRAARRPQNADDVALVEDPALCEGFQILCRGKLYDYSIQKRELS